MQICSFLKALRPVQTLRLNRLNLIPKNQYYQRIIREYECRKDIVKENEVINKKLKRIQMEFHEKIWSFIKDNKKKLIFMLIFIALMQYNDGYRRFMRWYKYKEPMQNKIKRWFFGEKNTLPPTIIEQQLRNFDLPKESIDSLQFSFLEKDNTLRLGISRKYISIIYKELGLLKTQEDKNRFYDNSGYGKRRNQKPAGVHIQEFIRLYQEAFQKYSKKSQPQMTEEEFRKMYLNLFDQNYERMKKWEVNSLQKRKDYWKDIPELEKYKQEFIKDQLIKDPLVPISELDKRVSDIGLDGLSCRDKVIVLYKQYALLLALKNHYEKKQEMQGLSDTKLKAIQTKYSNVNDMITQMQKKIDEYDAEFKSLYPGFEIYPAYK